MVISVFGLGYVGAVTCGCLASADTHVIGVDVQQAKVDAINSGQSPIVEPGLSERITEAVAGGWLKATCDAEEGVALSTVTIVCVGTPTLPNGRQNLEYVRNAVRQIAVALKSLLQPRKHTVIFRSTMLPGSTRALVQEYLAEAVEQGLAEVFFCPEFLREGSAVKDFQDPSLSVIGAADGAQTEIPSWLVGTMIEPDTQLLTWEGAELVKYGCNYFHALKVAFGNEIGRVCKHVGEDGIRLMQVLCSDTRLNISPNYLRPGAPFGGSCLPKDIGALRNLSRVEGVRLPLLESVSETNEEHLAALIRQITAKDRRRIGLLGLAFKADTDDLRGSHMVSVAETLIGRGYELHIYDPQVNLSRLIGANEAEIQRRMPHLASLLRSTAGEVIRQSDVIIGSQRMREIPDFSADIRPDQFLIDLVGQKDLKGLPWQYEGICW